MFFYDIISKSADEPTKYAGMAELADALDSGSSELALIQVQVLLPALLKPWLMAGAFCFNVKICLHFSATSFTNVIYSYGVHKNLSEVIK